MTDPIWADIEVPGEGVCPSCGGEEVIYLAYTIANRRPILARPCDCARRRMEDKRLRKVRRQIPVAFQNLAWDRKPIAELAPTATQKLRSYHRRLEEMVEYGLGLWLEGPTGTGKTAAACMLVVEARRRGVAAEFWPVSELLVRLARIRHDDSYSTFTSEEELHDIIETVPLLVLDDLSATKNSPFALEQLYVIINRRYNACRSTVVTTDFGQQELSRQFNARMIRRLVERSQDVIRFEPSVREHAAAYGASFPAAPRAT